MKPPCIRNLDKFKKKGCPEKRWDGGDGCPCWIELAVASKGNPQQKEIKKQCIDLWMYEFTWATLGTMEGVQIATEGNRNMTSMMALTVAGKMNINQLGDVASKQFKIEDKKS